MTTAAELAAGLGLDIAGLAGATGVDPSRVEVRPMPPMLRVSLAPWVQALTWRRTIYVRNRKPGRKLLVHELAHAGQWQRRPLMFLPTYVVDLLRGVIRHRSLRRGYESVPAEVAARAVAAAWA